MPSIPVRHPVVVLISVFAAFAGGPALGILVAYSVAPGSELVQIVSPMAFALAFVGGLLLWFGIGLVAVVGNALYRVLRGRWHWQRQSSSATQFVPPGYGAFLPLGVGFGFLAGVIAGLVPQSLSFWLACSAHVAAGAVYGGSLRALARHGYLPFPEPA